MRNALGLTRIHDNQPFHTGKFGISGRHKVIQPAQGVLIETLERLFLRAGENQHGSRIQQGRANQRGQSIKISILMTGNGGDFHMFSLSGAVFRSFFMPSGLTSQEELRGWQRANTSRR